MEPKFQAALGGTLFTLQWWAPVLDAIQHGATFVTAVGGAQLPPPLRWA